ncbi:hypothetical protein SNEBB_000093 [Seison nebaliae]|nr:hypothetical protein SNEBB_000093 [Seison nebaliae]
MSSQRGNVKRQRQKYKNTKAFKNDMHDSNGKQKQLNDMQLIDVCLHCYDIIKWKIKYKKYKTISQPAICTNCKERKVYRAYMTLCQPCSEKMNKCAKCAKVEPISIDDDEDNEDV